MGEAETEPAPESGAGAASPLLSSAGTCMGGASAPSSSVSDQPLIATLIECLARGPRLPEPGPMLLDPEGKATSQKRKPQDTRCLW